MPAYRIEKLYMVRTIVRGAPVASFWRMLLLRSPISKASRHDGWRTSFVSPAYSLTSGYAALTYTGDVANLARCGITAEAGSESVAKEGLSAHSWSVAAVPPPFAFEPSRTALRLER
jgi:hypothetical protein